MLREFHIHNITMVMYTMSLVKVPRAFQHKLLLQLIHALTQDRYPLSAILLLTIGWCNVCEYQQYYNIMALE